ncbi:MAG: rod shape-determining protein MreC [Bacteroides sp.]|nr:rod shape-determining protein MreC [Bacteroides sp.]MBD5277461.1 rod shape-determining protein MreC [Bacteroides sp.]MDE6043773.1 rod shape-determining protein MreC [Muribaculaceae bacterium]
MHEVFAFFARNSKWLVFAFYLVLSVMLLAGGDPYHRHLYLTSANSVSASVYDVTSNATAYFNLRERNTELNRRNAELQSEVLALREQLLRIDEQQCRDTLVLDSGVAPFRFIVAHVINNSVARPFNYLTINKGEKDGVRPEMGVIDASGVVGIVSVVGSRSARVISLLNPNFRLSCKLKGSDNFGSLVWDGRDPGIALLEELPRHTVYSPGDTVITSGYSAVFPAGLPVGIVMPDNYNDHENFFTLKVRLLSDFTALNNVQVVVSSLSAEASSLEEGEDQDEERAKKAFN